MRIRVSSETQVGRIGEGTIAISQHYLERVPFVVIVYNRQIYDMVSIKIRYGNVGNGSWHSQGRRPYALE